MADFDDNRFQSKSVEWATPENVFGPLNEEFRFTLDVAAADDNAKCNRYFTKETWMHGSHERMTGVV